MNKLCKVYFINKFTKYYFFIKLKLIFNNDFLFLIKYYDLIDINNNFNILYFKKII